VIEVTGDVDVLNRPVVPVVLRGPFGHERVDAVIDTGFSGALSVPDSLILRLGLEHYGIGRIRLADNVLRPVPIYRGEVDWVGDRQGCQVLHSELETVLLGRALLDGHVLRVDFGPEKRVEVR